MKTAMVVSAAVLSFSVVPAVVPEQRENGLVKLEKKLHGEWQGDP